MIDRSPPEGFRVDIPFNDLTKIDFAIMAVMANTIHHDVELPSRSEQTDLYEHDDVPPEDELGRGWRADEIADYIKLDCNAETIRAHLEGDANPQSLCDIGVVERNAFLERDMYLNPREYVAVYNGNQLADACNSHFDQDEEETMLRQKIKAETERQESQSRPPEDYF